jgi:hypothetical protein
MDTTTLRAATHRFPLVGRPRLTCPSLPERIHQIAQTAQAARKPGEDGLARAAEALNRSALLASDCGQANLARDLCWQHINLYRRIDRPLTVRQARYMLEPVLNLARLQIRADDSEQALRLLGATYRAVTTRTDLVIDGHTLPLAELTGTRQEHHKLCEWVWLQHLADGIRALSLAGRWNDAVTHAEAINGIGSHLMDGRQAMIIAHCLNGAPSAAQAVLAASTPTEPWEQQVAACLNAMCADQNQASSSQDIDTMAHIFYSQTPDPRYAVFRARLGLTVVTITDPINRRAADVVLSQVAEEVLLAGDAYAGRDVLEYRHRLDDTHHQALTELVATAGLRTGTLPEPLLRSLLNSVLAAKTALAATQVSS